MTSVAPHEQTKVPVTFGQAFAPGEVPNGRTIIASIGDSERLPVQIDQPARHSDGSLRFAILSIQLPRLGQREVVTVGLASAPPPPVAGPILSETEILGRAQDLQISLLVYAAESWRLKLGDFRGHTPGTAFQAGERINVQLSATSTDRILLEITPDLAGGSSESCTKLVETLATRINATGRYAAHRPPNTAGEIRITPVGPSRPFEVTLVYAGSAKTEAARVSAYQAPRVLMARLAQAKPSPPGAKPWLSGPIAAETMSRLVFLDDAGQQSEPRLIARVGLRAYPGSSALAADIAIENDSAFDQNPRLLTYDLAIQNGGTTLMSAVGIEHWPRARWRKRFWLEGQPSAEVRHNTPHLISTGALPPYDLRASPSPALTEQGRKLANTGVFAPMGPGGLTLYMPMTGGRPDIGLLPRWTAAYMIGLAASDLALVLGAAEGGGSAPIHYRDRKTDLPVSIDSHPTAAIRASQSAPADKMPEPAPGETPWTVDSAHQPSIAYAPYLLTGDRYYLEELHFWANWNLLVTNPEYRKKEAGLLWDNQLRGQAWSLRTLGEAAWVTPDEHPLKGYFNTKLTNNLTWYLQMTAGNSAPGGALRWLKAPDKPDEVSPWQNDMMAVVLAQLSRMGWRQADGILAWMADFVVGRWNAEAAGFCPANAPGYWWKTRSARNGRDFESWAEFNRFNFPNSGGCAPLSSMNDRHVPFAYPAISRAALAMLATRGVPGARETFDRVNAVMTAKWSDDPTWAFAP